MWCAAHPGWSGSRVKGLGQLLSYLINPGQAFLEAQGSGVVEPQEYEDRHRVSFRFLSDSRQHLSDNVAVSVSNRIWWQR